MFQKNSKFPRFFIYILLALLMIMLIGSFFSISIAGGVFSLLIFVSFVFLLIDKHYKFSLTNYKTVFFLADLIELVGVVVISVYNYEKYNAILNGFLIAVAVSLVIQIVVDVVFFKNERASKRECLLVNFLELLSMICLLVYFFKVTSIVFAIICLAIEVTGFLIKILMPKFAANLISAPSEPSGGVEEIISSVDEDREVE